jgi:predicted ATP-grasp superfamily ATP-dependent carboligase
MVLPLAIFGAGATLNLGGSIYGANMAKKDLKRQAMALEDQARLIEEQAQFDAIETGKQFESLLGNQKLSIATSGAEFEGSVMNILDQTLKDKEVNIATIKKNAEMQANFLRSQAQQARKKRKGLMRNTIISSLGNVAQGISSFNSVGKNN